MPLFPEFLYALAAKDREVTWLDPLQLRAQIFGTSATISADSPPVPQGRVLVLQHLAGIASPGAAETVNDVTLQLANPVNVLPLTMLAFQFTPAGAAQRPHGTAWTGSLVMLPGQFIRMNITKSAAVQSCTLDLYGWGVLIPAANWQR